MMRPFSDVDLHAFVDDQVSPERRAMIAGYLKTEPTEAARVESWRRQNDAIRSVFAGAAAEPVPLWLTIGQLANGKEKSGFAPLDRGADGRAAKSPAGPVRLVRRDGRAGRFWKAALLAGAAFATGAVLPFAIPQWPPAIERWLPASPRLEALRRLSLRTNEAHLTFGSDPDSPVEMLDNPAGSLAAWFKRHATFPVRVPNLQKIGWTLRGGRVVPGDLGPAALMVYENTVGDRLSLMVARVTNPSPIDTAYDVMTGQTMVWMDGPIGFGIATSKEGSWLSDNARILYRAVYESAGD